jgi:hypothetical protein
MNMFAQCCAVLVATVLCGCKKPDMAAFEENQLVAAALAAVQYRMCYGTYPPRLEAAQPFQFDGGGAIYYFEPTTGTAYHRAGYC